MIVGPRSEIRGSGESWRRADAVKCRMLVVEKRRLGQHLLVAKAIEYAIRRRETELSAVARMPSSLAPLFSLTSRPHRVNVEVASVPQTLLWPHGDDDGWRSRLLPPSSQIVSTLATTLATTKPNQDSDLAVRQV